VFFSYSFPYTFSKLGILLKEAALGFKKGKTPKLDYFGESVLCKSLSGVDIPMITITSRLNSDPNEYNLLKMTEFDDMDSKVSMPMYKRKKYIIISSRVHPGESNSSFMM